MLVARARLAWGQLFFDESAKKTRVACILCARTDLLSHRGEGFELCAAPRQRKEAPAEDVQLSATTGREWITDDDDDGRLVLLL